MIKIKTYGHFKDEDGLVWQAIEDFEYSHTDPHFIDEPDERFEGQEKYCSFPGDIYRAKAVPFHWNSSDPVPIRFVEKIVLTTGVDEDKKNVEPTHSDDLESTCFCYIQNSQGDMDCGEILKNEENQNG